MEYAGSGLPVPTNATNAKISSGKDCRQQMFADGGFVNPQIGEPFCLCALDSTTWQESFECEPSPALADGAVGLRVQRNGDTSNFKNFTMTVTGNAEMTLTQRAAPATAWVYRTASRRHLRVRVMPARTRAGLAVPGPEGQSGTWKNSSRHVPCERAQGRPDAGAGQRNLPRAGPGRQWIAGSTSRARRLIN